MEKVIRKGNLHRLQSAGEDIAYWLTRSAEERVAAVDYLRKQYHGNTARLQRVARIIQRA
ncbi:hypothetical protein DS62_05770 [Smithella sp. SC_K08D17]|nr:hypothetical protein DS62_05770 [Smithella sp. SC_K08D17]